jgi:hypothetical protein
MRISWILRDDDFRHPEYEHLAQTYGGRSQAIARGERFDNLTNLNGRCITHHDNGIIESRASTPDGYVRFAVWACGSVACAAVTRDPEAFHAALHKLQLAADLRASTGGNPVTTHPDDVAAGSAIIRAKEALVRVMLKGTDPADLLARTLYDVLTLDDTAITAEFWDRFAVDLDHSMVDTAAAAPVDAGPGYALDPYGTAPLSAATFAKITAEVVRAIAKHGLTHSPLNPATAPGECLAMLVDEVGDLAHTLTYHADSCWLDAELVHVAAVAAMWLQARVAGDPTAAGDFADALRDDLPRLPDQPQLPDPHIGELRALIEGNVHSLLGFL